VLSRANLGVVATTIDISDVAIEDAKRRAEEAGFAAGFRRADMLGQPPDLVDLISLSSGANCWVLTAFAEFTVLTPATGRSPAV
jgi:hypothetical protein